MHDVGLPQLIQLAGLGQAALCAASLAIPRVLGWREEVAKLQPLTREVFWTYAGYILATNLSFALISLGAPLSLLDGSTLAKAVVGYMTAYWGARLVIQLAAFRRVALPGALHMRLAFWGLTVLFVSLTFVYGSALTFDLRQ